MRRETKEWVNQHAQFPFLCTDWRDPVQRDKAKEELLQFTHYGQLKSSSRSAPRKDKFR